VNQRIGKMGMETKCVSWMRCKCSIPYEKRMRRAKRLLRVIESLGYRPSEQ